LENDELKPEDPYHYYYYPAGADYYHYRHLDR